MIDFTNCKEELNEYSGSEKKKTLIYNNHKYLVKFPDPVREKKKNISYINNAFSEYIGSKIFELIGFKTQKVILGTFNYNNKEKIVCACEDFTDDNNELYEFENIALSYNVDKKNDTELSDIMSVIEGNSVVDSKTTSVNFWNMFIVDALIGNTDRHNGNWGFIKNRKNKEITLSPVYDCGSCLNPMLEDDQIEVLDNKEIKNLSLNCYSCIKENSNKINYMEFIKSCHNKYCNEAVLNIYPKIDIDKINNFISSIECISDVRKTFYKSLINNRYQIIKKTYEKLKGDYK